MSDTRVTGSVTHNYVSKIGVLFSGCIFGMSGNPNDGAQFLRYVRTVVGSANNINQRWAYLQKVSASYSFPSESDRQFQILLSTRASGDPQLWILDSRDGLQLAPSQDLVTVGSGSHLLDEFVHSQIRSLRQGFADKSPELAETLAPYMLSFKVFRKFHSPEREVLEQAGVGGGFHFVYQTNEKEDGQLPTLLITADRGIDNHLMTWWMVRVVQCEIGCVVEVFTPPGQLSVADRGKYHRFVLLDPLGEWTLPRQEGPLTAQQQNCLQRSLDASVNLPFYSCCVIGATDPDYWSNTLTYFRSSSSDPYVIDRQGKVSERKVREIFRALYRKVGS